MSKVGRNDPCPCGSGKKYKQCHLPIDEAAAAEERNLRNAQDSLVAKLINAAQNHSTAIPAALERFWEGKYTPEQLAELDDLEGRGGERFLTWFAFDYPLDDGRTLVEQLAAGSGDLELDAYESRLLQEWVHVRLRPYRIEAIRKGKGFTVQDMLNDQQFEIEDQAAAKRVAVGEVLIVHLLSAANAYYIGGAAAHLTADTSEKLREFADIHLEAYQREHPGATFDDLLRARSEVLNHFVMALPVEAPDPSLLSSFLLQTRTMLSLTGESLGFGGKKERDGEGATGDSEPETSTTTPASS